MLKNLGFSDYESRIYTALLKAAPMTAYETARQAGVPNPKVYGALDRLEEKGMVQIIEQGGKKQYLPLEPKDFVAGQRKQLNRLLDNLEDALNDEAGEIPSNYVWNIRSHDDFCRKAVNLIETAQRELLISLWEQEYLICKEALDQAKKRGVKIAVIFFGNPMDGPDGAYGHPIKETLFNEKGGRSFSLVCDSQVALMGLFKENSVEASWSRSNGFTSLAEDYILHDIYIMKIVRRMDSQLKEYFGEGYPLLRDPFSDKELKNG